jgi:cytoskeletal protein RodZ
MKKLQERTLLVGAAVLVALALFGAWKFYQVHNAQNNVDAAQASIASLNAQVPKYDLVVAANQAYSAGIARRSSVLDAAVDWPTALAGLFRITPANAEVQAMSGSAVVATSGTAAATTPTTAAPAGSSAASSSSTTSAAIGTIQFGVTGPGPSLSISAAWINAIAGSTLFANPLQGATVVNPDSTISFPFSVSVTPAASLSKNASLK